MNWLRVSIFISIALLVSCKKHTKPSVKVLQHELVWHWPENNEVTVELLIQNDGDVEVSGLAEVQGTLDLSIILAREICSLMKKNNIRASDFKALVDSREGVDFQTTFAILEFYEKGWIQEPLHATRLEIPLDDPNVPMFDFCSYVSISLKPGETQLIKFSVWIPERYAHRQASFRIEYVK